MDDEIEKIIKKLKLQKLWDEDYIKENYRSDITICLEEDERVRHLFNWVYYLITENCIFPLHKLLSDESWQFCLGGPVDLFLINNGEIDQVRIGPNIFKDELLFYVVKKNTWFAATPAPGSKFSLITHCVSPAWVPEDDIAGFYDEMIKLAPKYPEFVKKFKWPNTRKIYTQHESYKR